MPLLLFDTRPIKERRKILHKEMIEIKNHVMFSEMQYIKVRFSFSSVVTFFHDSERK